MKETCAVNLTVPRGKTLVKMSVETVITYIDSANQDLHASFLSSLLLYELLALGPQPSKVLFRDLHPPRRDGRDMSSVRLIVKAFKVKNAPCCATKLCPLSPISEMVCVNVKRVHLQTCT